MKSKKSILFIILFLLASIGYFLYNNNNFSFALEDGSSKFSEDINEELEVYFLDQTTPNMIQRIRGIFERNPLISKEI